jgi:anhydro-N-acetylmuramic acid kinase
MSGTSLDGIDVAVVEIVPRGRGYTVRLERFETVPFAEYLCERIRAAVAPHAATVPELARLHVELGEIFGEAARAVAGSAVLDFVASHGQTIFHDGPHHVSWQLGDAFAIRERVGATICYDFRAADCAAGGQGAPLVPYTDALLLAGDRPRVALNLGGIANLTVLPANAVPEEVVAFDTGPANMLLDLFITERTRGQQYFDRNGAHAARGVVDASLLRAMLADPYFAQNPPKSTGRERFGAGFLAVHPRIATLTIEDGAATLLALSVESIAAAIRAHAPPGCEVVASGGGARNPAFLGKLRAALPESTVVTSAQYGLDPDAKEAIAFAVLGYETLRERSAALQRVTGARHGVVLGAIAPHNLAALLARVQAEVAA